MSNHENYGHFEVRQPIGRVTAENGDVVVPSRFGRRPVEFKPLAPMNSVFKATRVSSSTTPSRRGDSETLSDNPQTEYGAVDPNLSAQDRHFIGMLEDTSISDAESDAYFNSYFK